MQGDICSHRAKSLPPCAEGIQQPGGKMKYTILNLIWVSVLILALYFAVRLVRKAWTKH